MVNNMYPARVAALLFELVAEVGLDIESPYREELELNPPLSVDDFTDAVLFADFRGRPVRPALRRQVRARVLKHFLDAGQAGAGS
ncbi:MAG TPA: hypothetical protein VH475_06380 [Tepidisphaeraceae bacterium]|jgi:hypothetical protein